jgi:DeoR family transcriptional regulator, fructose operon transcriptional repressor
MEMFAEERKFEIIEYLKQKQKATVAELSSNFNVSSTTIRTDLRDLELHGAIIRTHGGAMVKSKTGLDLDIRAKAVQNIEAKRKIASLAIELIEDGDTIALDAGSTAQEFAKLFGQKRNITVVTNDLIAALICGEFESVHVILLGGAVKREYNCTLDDAGREMMSALTVDKAFMGTTGFTAEKGASVPGINHARIKQKMTEIANTVILLIDSSKFGRNSFAQFAAPEIIDIIVTEKTDSYVLHETENEDIKIITP